MVHATRDTLPLVRELAPDVVVADILTLAPALAAEIEGVPCATLIPHVYPARRAASFPIYSLGARMPRTRPGERCGAAHSASSSAGLERGRASSTARARSSGSPLGHVHGGISRELALVATFPQLEYPRSWPEHVHVVGPLMWEPPARRRSSCSARRRAARADRPLHRPGRRAQAAARRAARAGRRPVRVLATYNRRLPSAPLPVPDNARVVEWVSYSRTMPRCDVVVCHAGHGTLVRALSPGCAVVACPAVGDMNENAARLDWAGAGVRVPRRLSRRALRLAVERALGSPRSGAARESCGVGRSARCGRRRGATLLEDHVGRREAAAR